MNEYIEKLEGRLAVAADAEMRRGRCRRAVLAVRASGGRILGGAVAAAVVLIAVTVLGLSALSGVHADPAWALPALRAAPTDASGLRSVLGELAATGAHLDEARSIATPNGTGYVVPAAAGKICLAIPDIVPESYGQTCVDQAQAQRQGIVGTLIAASSSRPGSSYVAVLPAGARATAHFADGEVQELRPDPQGVVAATFTRDARVAVTVAGAVVTTVVPASEPEGDEVYVDCHGLTVLLRDGESRVQACKRFEREGGARRHPHVSAAQRALLERVVKRAATRQQPAP